MKKIVMPIIGLIILAQFSCLKKESPVALDTSDTLQITSTILPASAIGDWSNAGVQGEIPEYPVEVNVLDYGAIGNGTADDTEAILDAIAACPEDNAVFFPAGSYLTTNALVLSKSIVLRGAGTDQTHIIHNHPGNAIRLESGGDWAGIEELHVETVYPFSDYSGTKILMDGVSNSWAKDIETSGYVARHIQLVATTHCEVRDSYIHNSQEETTSVDPFRSYGVAIYHTGAEYNLVENNVLNWFRHAMDISGEAGGQGPQNNVFAYNFSWYVWTSDGGESATTDMCFHNNSVNYTLVEGNVIEQAEMRGTYHNFNTIFRNRVNNGGVAVGTDNYIVGNEFLAIKNPDSPQATWGNGLRGNNIGTCIIHGNYITVGDGLQWDPEIEDQNIPNSYYLSTKPEWFGDLEWPPYGGDLMPGNTRQNPAEVRYWTEIYPNLKNNR